MYVAHKYSNDDIILLESRNFRIDEFEEMQLYLLKSRIWAW